MAQDIVLTREGYEELSQKLQLLKSEGRSEIAEKLKVARSFGCKKTHPKLLHSRKNVRFNIINYSARHFCPDSALQNSEQNHH